MDVAYWSACISHHLCSQTSKKNIVVRVNQINIRKSTIMMMMSLYNVPVLILLGVAKVYKQQQGYVSGKMEH
jgi:hypothetical protein